MSDESALYQMMAYYTKREPDLYTDAILKALNGHTMAVELVAKQMALHQLTFREMYEILCAEGISGDDGKVRQLKDSTLREKTAFHHMEILFSVLDLSESEKQVLRCAALVGATPMERQYFEVIGDLNEAEISSLDRLIQSGWISEVYQDEMCTLSTHPLIVEVLCEKLRPNSRECKRILIMSGAVASYIEESENAEQRFLSVQWLDHMAHHIQGDDPELSYFFGTMCYPHSSVLSELGEFQDCNIIAAEALECFQKNFGELHEQMQWAYLMVGDNYRKAGDKENAKRYYDLAIRVLRENDYETDELEERVEEILQGM